MPTGGDVAAPAADAEPNVFQRLAKAIADPVARATTAAFSLGAPPRWEPNPDYPADPRAFPHRITRTPSGDVAAPPFAEQAGTFLTPDTPVGQLTTAGGLGGRRLGGFWGGLLGATAGGGGGALLEGQSPADAAKSGAVGGATYAGADVAARGGQALASRFRVSGTGTARDASMVGHAIGEVDPALAPPAPTVEGIQRQVIGGRAHDAARAARQAEVERISGELRRRGHAEYGALRPDQRNVSTIDLPDRRATRFTTLLDEYAKAGRGGYNPNTGEARPTVAGLEAVRDRAEIIADIERTLPPDLFRRFQAMQRRYAGVAEVERLFEPTRLVGNPIGPGADPTLGVLESSGLNMRELQRRAAEAEAALRSHLGDEKAEALLRALFRGGMPPVGDRRFSVPFSRHGGFALPLGVTWKAGAPLAPPATLSDLLFSVGVAGRDAGPPGATRP